MEEPVINKNYIFKHPLVIWEICVHEYLQGFFYYSGNTLMHALIQKVEMTSIQQRIHIFHNPHLIATSWILFSDLIIHIKDVL